MWENTEWAQIDMHLKGSYTTTMTNVLKDSPEFPPRILLVDDEPLTLKALERFFRSHGFKVLTAENAVQGLSKIRLNPLIQCVFSDYKMPGVNGVDFLQEAARVRPDVRLVILSAFDDSDILLAAMNEGGVHRYLVKPWNSKELLDVVEEQLAEHQRIEEDRLYVIELARRQHLLALNNQQLDALIAERTSKLVEREQELQEANLRLRQLTGRLEQLRDEECRAIALNIHDDLAQSLTAIQLTIAPHLQNTAETAPKAVLQTVKEQVDVVISAVQRILSNLRPQVLDELGLEAALDWLAKDLRERTGIECILIKSLDITRVPANISTCLYRIAQESLTNVSRHAKATEVELRLWCELDGIWLEIRDNGVGIGGGMMTKAGSFGIIGMQERVALCGGILSISPAGEKGTLIKVQLPMVGMESAP